MGLLKKSSEIEDGANVLELKSGSNMSTKVVYGNEASIMLATRPPGYHSRPHLHDCEQVNYVVSGSIWVFIEDEAFLAQEGDFFRIPTNAVHWGWVTGDKLCTTFQVHAPVLEPYTRKGATGLFAQDEEPNLRAEIITKRLSPDEEERYQRLERKVEGLDRSG